MDGDLIISITRMLFEEFNFLSDLIKPMIENVYFPTFFEDRSIRFGTKRLKNTPKFPSDLLFLSYVHLEV